ncbi:Rieske (2Fe-2S) protein [Nocardioides sp. BP30]|uniref:Rieske (2Fe-2S) protein n=1 Tax=Nocardioides sp. BP30 TaxID=3036374 RepID=UPI002468A8D6|nr:Rieske (2Fe-2S) protein [Nocardioides sp. BP30]WGL50910.1 Rieske (2Fe-2S) protein [Nocardioides sp. BP30]
MTEQKITRRHVIGGAAIVGVGVPLLAACGSSDGSATDSTGTSNTSGSSSAASSGGAAGSSSGSSSAQTLGPASDVTVGSGKIYTDAAVVVTQPTAGTYEGFSAICTHQGCPVTSISGGTINCTCHGSKFSIKDGSVVQGPATQSLEKVAVSVDGGNIVKS